MRNSYENFTARLSESIIKRGTWKVWIIAPKGSGLPSGWLRLGFAWKTRMGAERATYRAFPGIQFVS
jgi:hypothetical protein